MQRLILAIAAVTLLSACASSPESETDEVFTEMTIEYAMWSDDSRSPVQRDERRKNLIIARVAEWRGFPAMKKFTADADDEFLLKRNDGGTAIRAHMATGGITGSNGGTRFVVLHVADDVDRSIPYILEPRNQKPAYEWQVLDGMVEPIAKRDPRSVERGQEVQGNGGIVKLFVRDPSESHFDLSIGKVSSFRATRTGPCLTLYGGGLKFERDGKEVSAVLDLGLSSQLAERISFIYIGQEFEAIQRIGDKVVVVSTSGSETSELMECSALLRDGTTPDVRRPQSKFGHIYLVRWLDADGSPAMIKLMIIEQVGSQTVTFRWARL